MVEPFTHSISANQKQLVLETFLVNESQSTIEVASLSISGTKLLRSSCLDLRPGLICDIHDGAHGALSEVSVQDPSNKYDEEIVVDGTFEQLPCKQQRVNVTIPYRFTLDAKERTKVKIRFPRQVKVGS